MWYYKAGIIKPLECTYIGILEHDKGLSVTLHIVRFKPHGALLRVQLEELFETEEQAKAKAKAKGKA